MMSPHSASVRSALHPRRVGAYLVHGVYFVDGVCHVCHVDGVDVDGVDVCGVCHVCGVCYVCHECRVGHRSRGVNTRGKVWSH